ncbi:MAG: transglutaminase domain-containing protein [Gorillibacterium sp.]|nr:transglutaminase domain-containing protein [Gorillibacterium sp.]
MRKTLLSFIVTITMVLGLSLHPIAVAAESKISWLDVSNLNNGVISINYKVASTTRIKVMITKDSTKYTYNLNSKQETQSFPLQSGNGEYKVAILENISGNKYKTLQSDSISLALTDSASLYLNSIQNINWAESVTAVKKAQELTKGKKTDEEKAKAIYNYIIRTISYDYKLASTVTSDYLPVVDQVLTTKKGICYDYSSLYASMLRSVGIPAKLVMGNSSYVEEYHAWNEVFLNGKWITVDTTVDAGYKKSNKTISFSKDQSKYEALKVY